MSDENLSTMFIIDLHYIVPLEELDKHLAAHREFLDKYYAENIFVASGAKVPRTGGVILAVAGSAEEVEKIIAEDPFHQHQLAKYTITEFTATKYHPSLKDLLS